MNELLKEGIWVSREDLISYFKLPRDEIPSEGMILMGQENRMYDVFLYDYPRDRYFIKPVRVEKGLPA